MQYQTSAELESFVEATGRPATLPTTLIELLDQRAFHQPDQLAYTFLLDGETSELHLSYREVSRPDLESGWALKKEGRHADQMCIVLCRPNNDLGVRC